MTAKVGVLALQGSFIEHVHVLQMLNVEPVLIKMPNQLEKIDGLIIPGGESTTIGMLLKKYGFIEKLKRLISIDFPVYGTCAGMILLAKDGLDPNQPKIGTMDIIVKRNAFGRQLDSFEKFLHIQMLGTQPYRCIFIRAPLIIKFGPKIRILAQLINGAIVAAEECNTLVTSFHPELTSDTRIHQYFLKIVKNFIASREKY